MEAESVLELFDYCWFKEKIFTTNNPTAFQTNSDEDPEIEIQNPENFNFCRSRSILSRSVSDDLTSQVSFMASGSVSPHSVLLHLPQLQTVPSGKEMKLEVPDGMSGRVVNLGGKKKKKKTTTRGLMSKSMSELEFEEVKGFMDLGFVFSDEDKESSELASIIPGLGKKEEMDNDAKSIPARPYLSETWEWLDLREKKEKPLINWNFPALSNETDMKHNLKSWAHTVAIASSVR